MTVVIRRSQNQKILVRYFQLYAIKDLAVIRRFQQAVRLRKHQSLHEASVKLRRQTCATFRTTARKYFTAVSGGHASTEAVNTFAFQYAWLKRSFHGDDLTNRQWAVKTGWKIYSQNRSGILVKSWDKFNVCTQSKVNFPYRPFPPRASPESPLGCGQGV